MYPYERSGYFYVFHTQSVLASANSGLQCAHCSRYARQQGSNLATT